MKLLIFLSILFSVLSINAKDKHGHHGKDHKHDKEQTASILKKDAKSMIIKVNGMVCSFCAQGITKNFNERPEVKKTEVDLDKMQVSVTFNKDKKLSKKTIKKIVTDAGFSFEGVKK